MRIGRLSILAVAVVTSTGCSTMRTYFPGRDVLYKPIPVTAGVPRVENGDTSYVIESPSYELSTTARELLPDARKTLDLTARAFRRYFGAEPPKVMIVLREGGAPETGATVTAAGLRITYVPLVGTPTASIRDAMFLSDYLALAASRAWLVAYVDGLAARPTDPPRAIAASGSDGLVRQEAGGTLLPTARREDPRIPDWLEDAATAIVAGLPSQEFYLGELAARPADLVTLRELFAADRPEAEDGESSVALARARSNIPARRTVFGPRSGGRIRGSAGVRRAIHFATESYALMLYLTEREGPTFLADLTRRVARGEDPEAILVAARVGAQGLDDLEDDWKAWLEVKGWRR